MTTLGSLKWKSTRVRGFCIPHDSEPIVIGNDTVKIDQKMVPIILLLNRKGLSTRSCCQGDNDSESYPGKLLDLAMVWIDGPLARCFAHALLDDLIDNPVDIECLVINGWRYLNSVLLRWPTSRMEETAERFERVLQKVQ
jgi:hypothetical protein